VLISPLAPPLSFPAGTNSIAGSNRKPIGFESDVLETRASRSEKRGRYEYSGFLEEQKYNQTRNWALFANIFVRKSKGGWDWRSYGIILWSQVDHFK
jgi:hypothetical protein